MQLIDEIKSFFGFKTKAAASYSGTMYNQSVPTWATWKDGKTYSTVDFIYAVVDKISKTCAGIPIWGYDAKGEDLPDSAPFAMFLRSLTRAQRYEMFLWYWLRGECFGYKDKIIGANARVEKIYWLNPSRVDVEVSKEFPHNITGFLYRKDEVGPKMFIEPEEMIFIKDFNPSDDILESKRGLGKIQVLAKRLTKMKANMDNSVAQMQNGGVPGIVFQEDAPTPGKGVDVVGARRDNFARYLQNSDNKGAPFFAAGKMDYIRLGLSTVEMAAIEAELKDEKSVCNVFGISARLFNHDGTGSEVSDDNAQKSLYLNTCEPVTGMFEDEFNSSLAPDFGGGMYCKFDYSDVKVLQDDMLQVAQAAAAAPTFIPNEIRVAMGLARIDEDNMDKVYFKTGYVPIEDMGFDPLEDDPE